MLRGFKRFIKFLIILKVFLYTICFGNEIIKINVSDYTNSDIYFSPSIPVQKNVNLIKVKIHNNYLKVLENVKVEVKDETENNIIATNIVSIPSDSFIKLFLEWKPEKNGWHDIGITAISITPKYETKVKVKVPVVSKKLYFPWYGGSDEKDKKLRYANIVLASTPCMQEYWKERGVIPCLWKGVININTPQEYKEYLYSDILNSKADGILIDEMGGYSDYEISQTPHYIGLKEFTQEHPEIFVGLYVCGSLKPSYCNITKNPYRQKGVDLLMLEQYVNYQLKDFKTYSRYAYFDQRIETARDYDVISNAVMILAINDLPEDGIVVTPYDLEDQVRYIRKNAPEMQGVGFFLADADPKIVEFADYLCLKYWIRPVITIWDRDIVFSNPTPNAGEKITIWAYIHNIGGMDAKNIKVNFYEGNPKCGGKKISKTVYIPTVPADKGTPPGKYPIKIEWKVKKGYTDIFVEIIPEDNETTLLEGLAKRTIYGR